MALLKSTLIQGDARVTDTLYTNDLNLGTSTASQIVKTDANKNLITSSTIDVVSETTGTLPINRGGTNATTAADARTNLGTTPYIQGIFYGTCTTAKATKAKEVTLVNGEGFTLSTGVMIIVRFTNASAASTMTLKVGTTTAKNLYQYGTTVMSDATTTNGWTAGAVVPFIYDGTGWLRFYWYNTTYDLSQIISASGAGRVAETQANGGIGIHRYTLQMMTTNNAWSSLVVDSGQVLTDAANTADGTKVASTAEFLMDSPLIWQDTNAGAAVGTSAASSLNGYTAGGVSFRYSSKTDVSLTIQRPIYLVGTPGTKNGTFKLVSSNWWTQTLPTTNDGKLYMLLGLAYSATNFYLYPRHPIYYYNGNGYEIYTGSYPSLYCPFTIHSGTKGVQINHTAFTVATYVSQIVVTTGEANLNASIGWESANGNIKLTTATATSGDVVGYIIAQSGYAVTPTSTADITT